MDRLIEIFKWILIFTFIPVMAYFIGVISTTNYAWVLVFCLVIISLRVIFKINKENRAPLRK